MPGFSTEVPHQLGKDAATEKLKGFLEVVKERYRKEINEINGHWEGNVLTYDLTTFGIKVDGTLVVEEDAVQMQGNLPFAAMMFKGKIVNSIRDALQKVLTA